MKLITHFRFTLFVIRDFPCVFMVFTYIRIFGISFDYNQKEEGGRGRSNSVSDGGHHALNPELIDLKTTQQQLYNCIQLL